MAPLAEKKKVYWDACVWLALIKEEPGRVERCNYVIAQARLGHLEIWTSALTLAEVFKVTQNGQPNQLGEVNDHLFEEYLEQDYVTIVQVDVDIGTKARRLLRQFAPLKKPTDAIHLASAVMSGLVEFHTFDEANLIPLSGQVLETGGDAIVISFPPEDPNPGLFDGAAAAE
jgi:predicted nucleic acid-binding protein